MDDLRTERIVNAAADLLVSWGYQRITIGEVARRAGVGKGTVYLRFASKETLFLSVVLRSGLVMLDALGREFDRDPANVRPGRVAAFMYRRMREDVVCRALIGGDADTLGALGRHSALSTLPGDYAEVIDQYLEILRQAGLVRTDLATTQQRDAWMAVLVGFLATGRDSGELLEHVLREALDTDHGSPAHAAPAVAALLTSTIDRLHVAMSQHLKEFHERSVQPAGRPAPA